MLGQVSERIEGKLRGERGEGRQVREADEESQMTGPGEAGELRLPLDSAPSLRLAPCLCLPPGPLKYVSSGLS